MKKLITSLVLLSTFLKSYSYNGAERHDIPATLQAAAFNTNNSRFAIDSAQNLLITSNGAGLIRYNDTVYTNFNTSNSGIFSNKTYDVAVDAANNFYVACDSGLSVFNGVSWTNYSSSNSTIISANLKTIFEKNNVLYIGGNNGFSIFNNGVFTNFSTSNSGLSNDTINAFAVDANNDLWIATNNGLCKWNGLTMTVYNSSNSALPFNSINALFVEGVNLWILNQNAGIVRFQNAAFTALGQLANTALSYNFYAPRLSSGPKGGVLFIDYINRIFCEYYNGRIYTYFLQTGFTFTQNCTQIYDAVKQKLWVSSFSKQIVSLDFNIYQNTLASSNTTPPGIPTITAENCQSLDINEVKSAILNLGDMCWDGKDIKFEVPKGSGKHAIFANSLWIGGLTNSGNLKVAAQTYRQSGTDFWPGPLDTINGNTDTAMAAKYNRIWKINRQEIEDFKTNFLSGAVQNGSFIPAEAIISWPTSESGNYSRKIAPYVDFNNDGIYNPITGGDYPLIKGDQMLFWVFNDNLAWHTESEADPLKVEVHASAYAFKNQVLSNNDSILNYTTFYHYEVFNRSSDALDSCYMANWIDFDLGNPNDDAYGSIVQKNVAYCYNADSVDNGNGTNNYGSNPPIISAVILNGPIAYPNDGVDNNNNGIIDEAGERNQMTKSIFYDNNFSLSGNPSVSYHYYNYLNGKWKVSIENPAMGQAMPLWKAIALFTFIES